MSLSTILLLALAAWLTVRWLGRNAGAAAPRRRGRGGA